MTLSSVSYRNSSLMRGESGIILPGCVGGGLGQYEGGVKLKRNCVHFYKFRWGLVVWKEPGAIK